MLHSIDPAAARRTLPLETSTRVRATRREGRRPTAAAALLVLLAACNATGAPQTVERTQPLPGEGLEEFQPADVALAPLRNQTKVQGVPLALLREAFYVELTQRLYSPLSLEFVDANWSEASFGGTAAPEATMIVTVTHWDANRLLSSGTVVAGLEMRLWKGGSTSGTPLWGTSVVREVTVHDGRGQPGLTRDLLPEVATALAREALQELPERDPHAAVR